MAGVTDSCMDIDKYSTSYLHYYTLDIPVLLEKYLKQKPWQTFAELGCGDGGLLYALNKTGYFKDKDVFAIDISRDRVNVAQKIDPSIKCFEDDVCHIKNIKDHYIDFLVSKQVIEHVLEEESMLKEIARILKNNGIVYFSTVYKKKFAWYFYRCNGRWVLDPTHIREYTNEKSLTDLFAGSGLKIVESKKTLFCFPLTDFICKRMGLGRDAYKYKGMRFLRNFKIPIFGYYEWEMILTK